MKHLDLLKLIKILATLKNGYQDFSRYIAISNNDCRALWQYLREYPTYNDSTEAREEAHSYIYGEKAYDNSSMLHLVKLMRLLLVSFLTERQKEQSALGYFMDAETFRKHGLYQEMEEAYDRCLDLARDEVDAVRHFVRSRIYQGKYFRHWHRENVKKSKQELDRLNCVGRMKFIIDDLVVCLIKDTEINKELRLEIKQLFDLIAGNETPYIEVQTRAIQYYTCQNKVTFYAFNSAYFKHEADLKEGRDFLLIYLVNAVNLFPNPSEQIRRELLPLYTFGIENNLLLEDGFITVKRFNNIVNAAQTMGDVELLELAKLKLIPLIESEKNQKRCETFVDAYLAFYHKKHAEVAKYLEILDKDTRLPYTMILRKYMLGFKNSYEHGLEECVVYFDDKEQIFRNRLNEYAKKHFSEAYKQYYLNFIKLLKKMAKRNKKNISKSQLEEILASYKGAVSELKWLTEKIAELDE